MDQDEISVQDEISDQEDSDIVLEITEQRNNNYVLETVSDTISETDKKIEVTMRRHVLQQIIQPAYIKDISSLVDWRFKWRKIGNYLECFSQLLSLVGIIFAFSAGFYDDKSLSFYSGCMGSVSLALLKSSAYAFAESKERTGSLNTILSQLHIDTMPNIIVEDASKKKM